MGRMFWSEESDSRRNARRAREQVWLHPGVWWGMQLSSIGGAACGMIGAVLAHGRLLALVGVGLLLISVLVACVNDGIVRSRRRDGWEPIAGIHTRPARKDGEAPMTAAWRWTFHPPARTSIQAPDYRQGS